MRKFEILASAFLVLVLVGCDKPAPPAAQVRPVRAITIERSAEGETVSLTGQIRAKDEVSLAFRINGRMIERPVNVGDVLKPGQLVARLDPKDEQDSLRTAQANLVSAEAKLTDARLNFARKQELLKGGWTPRAQFDTAKQTLDTAQAEVDAAQARVSSAENQLSYTVLFADAAGAVTAKGAEPGEVVQAGQMIVKLARKGGRDAVFDVPEQLIRTGPRDPVVHLALTNDPTVQATGRVREVSPQADPTTRTFQAKIGIIDPPAAFTLGSTVTGSIKLAPPPGVEVPPSALTEANGRPAVWVFDPQSHTVSLRNVDVARYDPANVVISQGLETGEVVVTAGVQTLRPGEKVRLLGAG
jgi:membrane fusion protein, multidrug efflux system